MVYFVGFVILFSLSSGICLLFVDKWMYKLAKLMNLPPKQPSPIVKPIVKMGLWQLRIVCMFHIALGISLLIALVTESQLLSKLFWILVIFPIGAWVILPLMIEVYYLRNRKAIKKASAGNSKEVSR